MTDTIRLTQRVPVVSDVDVVVAGAGPAGAIAAIAAAREGASVALVDRFGYLGGNIGPGMFSGGAMSMAHMYTFAMLDRIKGVPGEFIDRCEGYCDHLLGKDYSKDHQVVAYVLFKMMEECNVQVMLNTFVSDPIVEGNTVKGLLVENKSGAQAIRAKVVIDATGDADVAFRVGALTDDVIGYVHPGMYFAIGDVDVAKYEAWLAQAQVPEEDLAWGREVAAKLQSWGAGSLRPFYSLFRKAWYLGEYRFVKPIDGIGTVTVDHGFYKPIHGCVGGQIGIPDKMTGVDTRILSGDNELMTRLEIGCRIYIFETAHFMRRYVPGFENSCLHTVSPYFHARGGRTAICEYMVTMDDFEKGRRFDDVVFVSYGSETEIRVEGGYDFPYRQFVPKNVNGLLMTGRAALVQPPTNRSRWKVLTMGQIAGLAAAQSARQNVTPGKIDVKQLQRTLHQRYHAYLGEPDRLKELGIFA